MFRGCHRREREHQLTPRHMMTPTARSQWVLQPSPPTARRHHSQKGAELILATHTSLHWCPPDNNALQDCP